MAGLFSKLLAGRRWQDRYGSAGTTAEKLDVAEQALASGSLLTNTSTQFKTRKTMLQSLIDTENSITAEKKALEEETKKALAAPELSASRNRLIDRTKGGFMSTLLGGKSLLGG